MQVSMTQVETGPAADAARPAAVRLKDVEKTFPHGQNPVPVLRGVTLDIVDGRFEALMGPSGSGKTTLLNLISGLDTPTSGSVIVKGVDVARLSQRERTKWRARHVGCVFQQYELIPVLSAFDNVQLPLALTRLSRAERMRRVGTALEVVEMSSRASHKPAALSGGQQQRVAIARALVTDPDLILADEPTGNLDADSATTVLDVLKHLNRDLRKTIVMVTHDPDAAARADRVVHLHKGSCQ